MKWLKWLLRAPFVLVLVALVILSSPILLFEWLEQNHNLGVAVARRLNCGGH
jgi:hypothetical protein